MAEITEEEFKNQMSQIPPERRRAAMLKLKSAGYTIKGTESGIISHVAMGVLGELTPSPEFVQKEILPIGGAMLGAAEGATLGAPIFPPFGAIAGGIGGAIIGGASGRAATSGIEAAFGHEQTPSDVMSGVAKTGMGMGIAEMAGGIPGGALKAGMSSLTKRAPNIAKAIQTAMSKDILPTIPQITQSKAWAATEEFLEKIPFVGSRIMAKRQEQEVAFNALRTKLLEKTGPKVGKEELGEQTRDTIQNLLDNTLAERQNNIAKLHKNLIDTTGPSLSTERLGRSLDDIRVQRTAIAKETAGKLYQDVADSIPTELNKVADTKLRETARKILDRHKMLPGETLNPKLRSMLESLSNGPGGKVIENSAEPIMLIPPANSPANKAIQERNFYIFDEMKTLRETINGLMEEEKAKVAGPMGARLTFSSGQFTPTMRYYSQLKKSLDLDLDAFAKTLPTDLQAKRAVADSFYREYKGTYGNETMSRLSKIAKDNPEDVYKMIVKPGDVNDIRRVKKVVGDAGFAPLRSKFMRDLVTAPDGTPFDSDEILKNCTRYGTETLQEIFTSKQVGQILGYVKTRQMPQFLQQEIEKTLSKLIMQSKTTGRPAQAIVKKIIGGDTNTVYAVRNIIGESGIKPYRREVMESIIGTPPEPGELLPNLPPSAVRIDKRLDSYGKDFLKAIGFTPKALGEIKEIEEIKYLMETQKRLGYSPSGAHVAAYATMLASAGEFGILLFTKPLGAAKFAAGASVGMIGADLLSRFYVSDIGRRLLIKGLNPKYINDVALASQITAFITNAKKEIMDDNRKKKGLKPIFYP